MKLKNEALVGLVVALGVVVAVAGSVFLSGVRWGEEQILVRAAFQEVGVLSEGNPVKYRGVQVGRVTAIELAPLGTGVIVTMAVDESVTLPPDPGVVVAAESFFGDWQATIVSRRAVTGLEFTDIPGADDVLPGATLPDITQLTAVAANIAEDLEILSDRVQVAFTEETAVRLRETVENVAEISEQLEGFVGQQTEVYAQVSENVLLSTRNIEQATARVEELTTRVDQAIDPGELEAIVRNVRLTTENLQQFTAQLDTITAGVPGLVEDLGVTIRTATRVIAQLEPAAAEVGPTLIEARAAVTSLNALIQNVQEGEGALGRLIQDPALYEETQRAVTALQRLLADLQANPGKYIGEVQVF